MNEPFSFAILRYMAANGGADQHEVVRALRPHYGDRHGFDEHHVLEFLMTGVKNGLLETCGLAVDARGELLVSFRTTDEGRATIERYLGR